MKPLGHGLLLAGLPVGRVSLAPGPVLCHTWKRPHAVRPMSRVARVASDVDNKTDQLAGLKHTVAPEGPATAITLGSISEQRRLLLPDHPISSPGARGQVSSPFVPRFPSISDLGAMAILELWEEFILQACVLGAHGEPVGGSRHCWGGCHCGGCDTLAQHPLAAPEWRQPSPHPPPPHRTVSSTGPVRSPELYLFLSTSGS